MTLRVPMVSPERARELGEAMGMPARRTGSEAFRVVANNPGVARVAFTQLMQLLENNKLDTRLRELMIMRIGWVTGSAYEWTQHWRVATTAGIPPEDILAVRDWRNSDRLGARRQRDPDGDRRMPRRQVDLGRRLGGGREICHRSRRAGRVRHRHGKLDVVLDVVPKFAYPARRRGRGVAARRQALPGGGELRWSRPGSPTTPRPISRSIRSSCPSISEKTKPASRRVSGCGRNLRGSRRGAAARRQFAGADLGQHRRGGRGPPRRRGRRAHH